MDIKIENEKNVFQYRVAIVIQKKDHILVQKDHRSSHVTFPGGRCQL